MTLLELTVKIIALIEEAKTVPSSRELSLCITKLQEAYLWLNERAAVELKAGVKDNK